MDMALYHPSLGYYSSEGEKIGWTGDFYTSPDVHRAFAATIMKQLLEMRDLLGAENELFVVEAGAGKGTLCADILESSRERYPSFFSSMKYVIVEKSRALTAAQNDLLKKRGFADKVCWAPDIESFLKTADRAVIFSNELLDAFPVHRVTFDGKGWKELYVTVSNDRLIETSSHLSTDKLDNFLAELEGPFEKGYTTEVNLDARKWIKTVGQTLRRGFVMTIDYGYPRADYYCKERRDGTLLCYFRHSASNDPYARIGKQDITAHVDFTSIAEAGNEAGLTVNGYCEQFHFLMGLGVIEELKDTGDKDGFDLASFQENLAIKKLLMPESMGGVFKVLIQSKGVKGSTLGAFSFKNLSHRLFS